MLLAAIARPEKTAALVGISTAADHLVTSFSSLPLEVRTLNMNIITQFRGYIHFYFLTLSVFEFVGT